MKIKAVDDLLIGNEPEEFNEMLHDVMISYLEHENPTKEIKDKYITKYLQLREFFKALDVKRTSRLILQSANLSLFLEILFLF